MAQKGKKPPPRRAWNPFWQRWLGGGVLALAAVIFFSTEYESYASLYDADYVGAETCGACHKIIYDQWQESPHAKMTRKPSAASVVGDFNDTTWTLPPEYQKLPGDDQPAAHIFQQDGAYYMALRHPTTGQFVPFRIDYVIGYQYRQTYLTLEPGGVLRKLPLEWSMGQQAFFPYWNFQEGSTPSIEDLWAQMTSLNSAWNLFCARCHTTHLTIVQKDADHTFAETYWVNDGIACEACHGPGSQHVNYFAGNYVNRVVAFLNSNLRGQPVAFIANPPQLTRGQDLSTCARCHGPDISMSTTEVYRVYEPGYSREGRINDLSDYFKQFPLTPGRTDQTVEVWLDGRPKGIGMLFRSFIESVCYEQAEVRCYDCHDPHNNKQPARPGILEASAVSNDYCLACHSQLAGQIAQHSRHEAGTAGSFCYDCHLPRHIMNLGDGTLRWTRSHTFSYIPQPELTEQFGPDGSPNACNDCHTDQSAAWAAGWVEGWWAADGNG
ncbi:MAG: cytochrome c3 family protein [Chloroflexota bacterium]